MFQRGTKLTIDFDVDSSMDVSIHLNLNRHIDLDIDANIDANYCVKVRISLLALTRAKPLEE